jgi:RIO kinase 1
LEDDISRKLESKLDEKLFSQSRKKQLKDGFKKGKVVNEVSIFSIQKKTA